MIGVHAVAPWGQIGREQVQQTPEAVQQRREAAEQQREAAERQREAIEAAREAQEAAREATQEAARAAREAAREVRGFRIPPPPEPPSPQEPIIIHPRRGPWDDRPIPGEVVDIVGMLTFATAAVLILRPLMRAFANRFERRGAPPAALPPEVTEQMQRLEHAIEAVAIEVERISEGQRYTTKLLSERGGKSGSGVS
jgi:hypothetical protein